VRDFRTYHCNLNLQLIIINYSPHMRKLYGDSLRKDAGFVKVMKTVATKNAKILESRAGKHAPELKRVAREVIGTFDKVYEETADAVEEFLARCKYIQPECVFMNNNRVPPIP